MTINHDLLNISMTLNHHLPNTERITKKLTLVVYLSFLLCQYQGFRAIAWTAKVVSTSGLYSFSGDIIPPSDYVTTNINLSSELKTTL